MSGIFVGSIGDPITFQGQVDFTAYDNVELEVERPDGTSFTMSATVDGSDGTILTATTASGQFTMPDTYLVWGHGWMDDSSANRRTGIGSLVVYRIGEGVTP